MEKLTLEDFEKNLAEIPEEAPDEWDLKMLKEIDEEKDKSTVLLETVKTHRKRNHARAYEREKETIKRIVVKVDKETAQKFTDTVTKSGETVQGHIRQYIDTYISQHK